jgi:tetratricopeptide (TPR) repeat protein
MLKDRFAQLERKIKAAAELINRLKQENMALEMKCAEAKKKIDELTDEMERHRREQEEFSNRIEDLMDHFKEFPDESEVDGDYPDGLTVVDGLETPEESEPEFELESEEDLDNYLTQFELGKSYEKKASWDRAIQAYRRAIDIKPDFIDAIEHLAFLLERLNREKEASPLWEKVISLRR